MPFCFLTPWGRGEEGSALALIFTQRDCREICRGMSIKKWKDLPERGPPPRGWGNVQKGLFRIVQAKKQTRRIVAKVMLTATETPPGLAFSGKNLRFRVMNM
jgi:hypothetical protein